LGGGVWGKLIRFGQIWLDLGKIEAKFGGNLLDLDKFGWIWAKLKRNLGEID